MAIMPLQLITGIFLGLLIGYLAYRGRALTRSGAWAAALVGGLTFGLGGFGWAVLLLAFFVSSSGLSRAFVRRKKGLSEKFSKGSRRDSGQVLANGGLGALLALAGAFSAGWAGFNWLTEDWAFIAFAGSMAAVNADTWATELGVLSPVLPRLITTGRPVEGGTSGAVSLAGSLAALGGAALIALCALPFSPPAVPGASPLFLAGAIVLGGLAGSFCDSFLGATVQAIYHCPACCKETERHPTHTCGTATVQVRGWAWLNNDRVNFACAVTGAAVTLLLWLFLL